MTTTTAGTTDLAVSIMDTDNTIEQDEKTVVEIKITEADTGIGAAEFGVELSDSNVATITDVTVQNSPGITDNSIASDGGSVDLKYAFADDSKTGEVVIVTMTIQGDSAGTTDITIGQNSATGALATCNGEGVVYTLNNTGTATLTVE